MPKVRIRDELAVEDRASVEDRQPSAEASKLSGQRLVAQPAADLASAVAGLQVAVRLVDDQPADAVDLRLDRVAERLGDRGVEGFRPGASDELRDDGRDGHAR